MYNMFSTLKIGEKENTVSNLLAYWFDYSETESQDALNALLNAAELATTSSKNICIRREKSVAKKDNRYDIIVLIGNDPVLPERVICIENKINAQEGKNQTDRYYREIERKYSKVPQRDYIFLAKDNGCLKLSNPNFKQVKYHVFAEELDKIVKKSMFPGMIDFIEYYWKIPASRFSALSSAYITNANEFVEYLVWYNDVEASGTLSMRGLSGYHSNKKNFQIDLMDSFVLDNGNKIPMNLHLEGDNRRAKVHFETQPYIPYGSLDEKINKGFQNNYITERDKLRKYIVPKGYKVPSGNANLTICDIMFTKTTYKELAMEILAISEEIQRLLKMAV